MKDLEVFELSAGDTVNVAHEITEGTTLRAVRNVDRRAAPRLGATVKFYPHRQRLRRASRRAPRVEVRAACRLSGVLPRAQRGASRVERRTPHRLSM